MRRHCSDRDFGRAQRRRVRRGRWRSRGAPPGRGHERELAGALAYRLRGDELHIVALATDPTWQRSGVGAPPGREAELLAQPPRPVAASCSATTNDNLPALYFYQRRGYVITRVVTVGC